MKCAGYGLFGGLLASMMALLPGVAAPIATADNTVVPRANAVCTSALDGALTWNVYAKEGSKEGQLICQNQGPQGYLWVAIDEHWPITKYLTTGYQVSLPYENDLRGATIIGTPNRHGGYDIAMPSMWVGTPQASDAQCTAEQKSTVKVDLPVVAGSTAKPVMVAVDANMSTLKLTGYCLWTQTSP